MNEDRVPAETVEKVESMSVTATMRALQQASLDGALGLHLVTDAPVPSPGPSQILIRVVAAGINFADIERSRGDFFNGPQPPYLAGFEAAGEILEIGAEVTGLAPGAHVVGVGYGAFAEYMALDAGASASVPAGWADAQALGMLVSWPTALAALRPLGGIADGQTVLIHAAAGGTGQAAVKIAKHYGATVIGTASPEKLETLRALGVDYALDSHSAELASEVLRVTDGRGVDLVLESVGGSTFDASLAVAKRVTGRVVVTGMAAGRASITNWDLVYKNQVQIVGLNLGALIEFAPQIFGEVMGELYGLIASRVLTPCDPTVYDLADGRKAMSDLESRQTVGKIALVP